MVPFLLRFLFQVVFLFLVFSCSRKLRESDITLNILLNPHGNAPLSALAGITLPGNDFYSVTVTVKGKNSSKSLDISHTFIKQSGKFSLPILGLYPDHTNQIEIRFQDEAGKEIALTKEIITDPLDEELIIPIEIFINRLDPEDQGIYLVDNIRIAFDQYGEIRWAYTGDSFLNYGKLANGNLIINSGEDIRLLYHYHQFYEVSMTGEIIRTYDISDYYGHHDLWEITTGPETGNFIVGVNEASPSTNENVGEDGVGQEDILILIDRMTGKVKKSWDLKKLFDAKNPYQHHIPRGKMMHPDDWIHENAHYYDPEDNSIVFSSRHQSAVVKFDYDTGRLIWILTDNSLRQWDHHTNFYGQVIADHILQPISIKSGNKEKIIDPGAINFWPYGQHAVKRIGGKDGLEHILLYDNGNARNFFQYGKQKQKYFSRAIEYRVNRENMSVEKVWKFDAGKKYFTVATGSVDLLTEGKSQDHRLIGYMWVSKDKSTPRIFELDPQGNVVFEARFNEGKTFYYQIEKFNLYQGLP